MTSQPAAVRRTDVSLAEALTWFATAPEGRRSIGFRFAPEAAGWFALDPAGRAVDPVGDSIELATTFEAVASDGARHLRWLHDHDGRGTVVVQGSDVDRLPAGEDCSRGDVFVVNDTVRRVEGTVRRVLSGRDDPNGPWVEVHSARYGPVSLPVAAGVGESVQVVSRELVVKDEHGNLSVIDTVLTGLQAAAQSTPTRRS